MDTAADNESRLSSVESFYKEYIARSEELRAAIERREWADIERYVLWREELLGALHTLPVDAELLEHVHKEYLNRIMILELENINSLNEVMGSLKASIREGQKQKLAVRYAENA
jgi:hypothetical protein